METTHDSLTVSFVHRRNGAADLDWSYETSTDLDQWSATTPTTVTTETIPGDSSGAILSRAEFTLPGTDAEIFVRLKLQEP